MSLNKKSIILSKIVIIVLISLHQIWAAGEIDTGFNVAAYRVPNSYSNQAMIVQSDGKILVAFSEYGVSNGIPVKGFTRFNPDGTVDDSFQPPNFTSGNIFALGLQSGGKILIRGSFIIANSPYRYIARLNTDGSVDTSFNVISTPMGGSYPVIVQPDDSFFTGNIYKFDANGFPINTFNFQPLGDYFTAIAATPDGKIYVGNTYPALDVINRYNADGTRDTSFQTVQLNERVSKIALQPDGKIIVIGAFTSVNSVPAGRITRINTDGSVDSSFNLGGAGFSERAYSVKIQPDGKILVGGYFNRINDFFWGKLVRLNSDGTRDTTFSFQGTSSSEVSIELLDLLPDNRIVVGGSVIGMNGLLSSFVLANPGGTLVPDFYMQRAMTPQRVRRITVQSDNTIYLAGEFDTINGYRRNNLVRLNPNGKVDTNFIPYFAYAGISNIQAIHQVLVQPDGKVLVSFTHGLVMVRLNSIGGPDETFNHPFSSNYIIYDFALQSDGKILVVGENPFVANTFVFARLNSNGSLDTTFNPVVPNGRIYKILLQPDGKSIICGEFTQVAGSGRRKIARYNSDGSLDQTFNPESSIDGNVYDIDLQTDGKVVIGGTFGMVSGNVGTTRVGRLNSNGSFDTSFTQNVDSTVQTVKVQSDGKVLIGGLFANVGGTPREKLARLNSNGALDSSFTASANALVFDVNVQADGKILVGGDFTKVSNVNKFGIARLNNSAPLGKPFDYDGDGRSDVSVFRPSENKWFILRSSDSSVAQPIFGSAGDIPAPSDFDGDGKTDPAVFRPSTGVWWYLSSLNGNQIAAQWGQNGDIPRPSDFDGDGKADFIVFRPSDNKWYRLSSSGTGSSIVEFGSTGDKPLVGDFDGDGKSDPAIYRPSTGVWWYAASGSAGAHRAAQFGIATDTPVPADYDGDGKTDFAVYRPSNGVWHILQSGSSNNYIAYQFGIGEDKAVAADYDGDGKADMAVFRPSTGSWYQMRTTSGFSGIQWGTANDIPTPNAFIPY